MVQSGPARSKARFLLVAIALIVLMAQSQGILSARATPSRTASHLASVDHPVEHGRRKAFTDCNSGDVCLFEDAGFGGQMEHYQSCCAWIPLSDKQMNNKASSWRNRLNVDVLLAKNADGSGDHLCLNNNDSDSQLGAAWDDASSAIRIRESDTIC